MSRKQETNVAILFPFFVLMFVIYIVTLFRTVFGY